MEVKVMELEAKVSELTAECDILRKQLARVGALGNTDKEKLLEQIIKSYPDCYNRTEFDNAFDNALKT